MNKMDSSERNAITGAYEFFNQAPVIIGFVRGEEYIIEFANQDLLKVWKADSGIRGKSLFAVFPELEKQGFRHLLDNVRQTGKPFNAYEFPIVFERPEGTETYYFDFIYQPFWQGSTITGVIAVGHDVTEKVNAKKSVERGERKWRQLANSLPVMVWTADENGSVDFFNEQWTNVTGMSQEESLGSGWAKALHPDDVARCVETWNRALAGKTFYELQARIRTKDGDYRWIIGRGVPIIEEGQVISWYGTNTDITGQKNTERQLQELVQQGTKEIAEKTILLDNIMRYSSNGISVSRMIKDENGEVIDAVKVLANDAAVKFSGLPREDYLSKPMTYFDPNLRESAYGQACINTLKTGEPFIMRYYLDFSKRWLELTVSKMDDDHLIHHFTDVTSIREGELRLERTLEELRYSNANLEEFAYAASHDLKEPIRKAQFFTNLLKEGLTGRLDDREAHLFQRLENSQRRMQTLIEDLLEYSQAAKGSLEKQSVDLTATIQNVLEDLELEIQKKNAIINVGTLPTISGNKRQLHQLLQNLVSNALKYHKPGTSPQIEISSDLVAGHNFRERVSPHQLDERFQHIKVSDQGIGFAQEDAERIFKVFTRLHSKEDYRGSGVGLSIVRRVVDSHNGYVWAESAPDNGSVFHILLPALKS